LGGDVQARKASGKSMKNRTIPALDLVRFAAALMVMWFHLAYATWARPNSTQGVISGGAVNFPELDPFAAWGWIGVELFFVLSGFVICYSAAGKTAGQFALGRALRLYPAVWICAPITALALLAIGAGNVGGPLLRTMALSPWEPWIDGVYWTLGIEMAFYALIWLLLLCGGFRWIQWALIAIGLPSAAIWYLTSIGAFDPGVIPMRTFQLTLLRHGCHFALGGLMFLNVDRGHSIARLAACAFFAGACLIEIYHVPESAQLTAAIVWSLAVACIGLGAKFNDRVTRFIPAGPARMMGLATYPLYLIHDVPGAAILRVTRDLPDYLALALAMGAVTALSFVLLWPERWLRTALGRAFRRSAKPTETGTKLAA
jgi:peptidoglycan/LPS O-acetylase OafA/YrhL